MMQVENFGTKAAVNETADDSRAKADAQAYKEGKEIQEREAARRSQTAQEHLPPVTIEEVQQRPYVVADVYGLGADDKLPSRELIATRIAAAFGIKPEEMKMYFEENKKLHPEWKDMYSPFFEVPDGKSYDAAIKSLMSRADANGAVSIPELVPGGIESIHRWTRNKDVEAAMKLLHVEKRADIPANAEIKKWDPTWKERLDELIREYCPGLASLNTPEGMQTDAAKAMINGFLKAGSVGIINMGDAKANSKERQEYVQAAQIMGEFIGALIPYAIAADVIKAAQALPRIKAAMEVLQEAGTFGRIAANSTPIVGTVASVETAKNGVEVMRGDKSITQAFKDVAGATLTATLARFVTPQKATALTTAIINGGAFALYGEATGKPTAPGDNVATDFLLNTLVGYMTPELSLRGEPELTTVEPSAIKVEPSASNRRVKIEQELTEPERLRLPRDEGPFTDADEAAFVEIGRKIWQRQPVTHFEEASWLRLCERTSSAQRVDFLRKITIPADGAGYERQTLDQLTELPRVKPSGKVENYPFEKLRPGQSPQNTPPYEKYADFYHAEVVVDNQPAKEYEVEGYNTKIIVKESEADAFEKSDTMSKILSYLKVCPNPQQIERVVICTDPSPDEAFRKTADESTDGIILADANPTAGTIRVYSSRLGQSTMPLERVLNHEWAHLVQGNLETFKIAASLEGAEANPHVRREYANTNVRENWAVHFGEQLLDPNSAEFVNLIQGAPLRTVAMVEKLKVELQKAQANRDPNKPLSPDELVLQDRIKLAEDKTYAAARDKLTSYIKSGNKAQREQALEFLSHVEDPDVAARLCDAPALLDFARKANFPPLYEAILPVASKALTAKNPADLYKELFELSGNPAAHQAVTELLPKLIIDKRIKAQLEQRLNNSH